MTIVTYLIAVAVAFFGLMFVVGRKARSFV